MNLKADKGQAEQTFEGVILETQKSTDMLELLHIHEDRQHHCHMVL